MKKFITRKPQRLIASKSPMFLRDPSVIFRNLSEQNGTVYCDEGACFILINFLREHGSDVIVADTSNSGLGVNCNYRGRNVYVLISGEKSRIDQLT